MSPLARPLARPLASRRTGRDPARYDRLRVFRDATQPPTWLSPTSGGPA
jgi:hypothetical protein